MTEGRIAVVVDGVTVLMRQPIAASDVLRLGGLVGEGVVIRTDGGRASRFAPEAPVTFDADAVRPVFRTFRGTVHVFRVDGLRWDWGAPLIRVAEVRAIGGIAAEAQVRLRGVDGCLSPTALIDLTTEPSPRLVTQPRSSWHRSHQGSEVGDETRSRFDPTVARRLKGTNTPTGDRSESESDMDRIGASTFNCRQAAGMVRDGHGVAGRVAGHAVRMRDPGKDGER
jgi:hypothetical protein